MSNLIIKKITYEYNVPTYVKPHNAIYYMLIFTNIDK